VIVRSFILSIMILSYGSLMGHEIVFGHHTSNEVNCHHNDSDCCDHHGDQQNHTPCLIDIKPHFISSQDVQVPDSEGFEVDLGVYFIVDFLNIDILPDIKREIPPDRTIAEDYNSSYYRSHGLRGPPLA